MTVVQTLVDLEDIRSSSLEDWVKMKEFLGTGNIYWLHSPTSTWMVVKMSDAHPVEAEPIDEFVLLPVWGEIKIQVISPQVIKIKVPTVNLFDSLTIDLEEALWLSAHTALVLRSQPVDSDSAAIYKVVTTHE